MEDDWVLMNDDCLKELEANVKDNNEPPGMFLVRTDLFSDRQKNPTRMIGR